MGVRHEEPGEYYAGGNDTDNDSDPDEGSGANEKIPDFQKSSIFNFQSTIM